MSGKVGKIDAVDVTEFETANDRRTATCWFARLPFTDEQREKLTIACDERPEIRHTSIARVLLKWNFRVDEGSVSRHRRRECMCPK